LARGPIAAFAGLPVNVWYMLAAQRQFVAEDEMGLSGFPCMA